MKQIVKQRFHGTENDRDLIEAEIQVDELEELPEPDEFEGKRLIMGSQCWVIGTGDLYGLTSTGDWVKVNFMGNGEGGGGGSAYAHSLELTINSQTYVLTATLKNTSGETLGTPQTIDLPLETMVVGGSYDDATKKVILTLKNGNTVDFSVADLVSGLQTEITSTNKLNSDLVDDTNQNNKFVTSAEKTKIANALTIVTDEIEEGNMNPITSNAVSNIHKSIFTTLKEKTVPGLTLTWGPDLYDVPGSGYKRKLGDMAIFVLCIDLTVKGTYHGQYYLGRNVG